MKTKTLKKGEILQSIGDINTKAYRVKNGLLRSYSIDNKGKEHIFIFAPEGWIISDSQIDNIPSELFIDALEDSEVEVIDKNMNSMPTDITPIMRRLSVLQKRILMLMSSTGIERYQHFTETYPNILERVPQRMIASYLGITPEALSKVKNDYLKNN